MKESFIRCFACHDAILTKYLMRVDGKYFHEDCLKCFECNQILSMKCYIHDDKLLCLNDYNRRKSCFKCKKPIAATEMIRKTKILEETMIFHLHCFVCSVCCRTLQTGHEYLTTNHGHLVCADERCTQLIFYEQDDDEDDGPCQYENNIDHVINYDSLSEKDLNEAEPIKPSSFKEFDWFHSNDVANPSVSDAKNQSENDADNANSNQEINLNQCCTSFDMFEREKSASDKNKKKRGPRTTIKPNQLEELKKAFQKSSKPAKHVRETLSKKTGLDMRVIQVWFQNRRSKERRVNQANRNCNQNFYDETINSNFSSHSKFGFLASNFQDQCFHSNLFPHGGQMPSGQMVSQIISENFLPKSTWIQNQPNDFAFVQNSATIPSSSIGAHCTSNPLLGTGRYSSSQSFQTETAIDNVSQITNFTCDPSYPNSRPESLTLWPYC